MLRLVKVISAWFVLVYRCLLRMASDLLSVFLGSVSEPGEITVLGHRYDAQKESAELKAHIRRLVWLTYRKGFAPIHGDYQLTSDTGWGCTYRSGQMLLAQALMANAQPAPRLMRLEGVTPSTWQHEQTRRAILSMFQDTHHPSAYFSIQHMAESAFIFQKKPGQWISPSEVALIIRRLNQRDTGMRVRIVNDTLVSTRKIIGDEEWTPTLMLVPLRAGLETLQQESMAAFVSFFDWPWCVGAIGGKPGSAFYYVGIDHDRSRVLYLDPHTTKTRLDLSVQAAEKTCVPDRLKSMELSKSCSSICVGLFLPRLEDFVEFVQRYKREQLSGVWSTPLFEVVNDADLAISDEPHETDAPVLETAFRQSHAEEEGDEASHAQENDSHYEPQLPESSLRHRPNPQTSQRQQHQQQHHRHDGPPARNHTAPATSPISLHSTPASSSSSSSTPRFDPSRRFTVAGSQLSRRTHQQRQLRQEDDDEDGFVVVDYALPK